jgi:hypothetical protein
MIPSRLRVIAWIAVLAPLPYGVSRLLWAAGIPVGIREESLENMLHLPGWNSLAVLGLAALAEGTALYTHALILAGRRPVRGWLAVVPLIAALAVMWGINLWSVQYILDGFALPPESGQDLPAWSFWGQTAVFWIWGSALAVATAAYLLVEVFPYRHIMSAWLERQPRRTRSTR